MLIIMINNTTTFLSSLIEKLDSCIMTELKSKGILEEIIFNENIAFLPLEMIKIIGSDMISEIEKDGKLEKITFSIFALTTRADYRCRELDKYSIDINNENECPNLVKEYIKNHIQVYCNGKHPQWNLTGNLEEEDQSWEYTSYADYSMLSSEGYVWIYIG